MVDLGDGGGISVMMEGPFGGSGRIVKVTKFSLPKDDWKGAESPYSMIVSLDGISKNSKVDIWPSKEQIALLGHMRCGLCAANESGVVTVYAIGEKPTEDITVQVTITDVSTSGTLYGNLVFPAVYADSVIGLTDMCLSTDGGTMNGILNMNGQPISGLNAPTEGTQAANKGYVDSVGNAAKSYAKTTDVSLSLPASSWVGDSAPYTQAVTVDGLTDGRRARVYPAYGGVNIDTDLAMRAACAAVSYAKQDGGNITFVCLEDKPEVDISIEVEVYA